MQDKESKYLPNWKEAEVHGLASKVGFFNEESHEVCHCCQQYADKKEIPLCQNTKSLEFLGFGFPLFYMFIRNCILLLILLIISNNLISLYISVQDGTKFCNSHPPAHSTPHSAHTHFLSSRFAHGQEGEEEEDPNLFMTRKCESFFIMIARTDKSLKDYEVVLRVGSFIIHVLALLYIKDKISKTWEYYDQRESDLSDYAAIVKDIPEGTTKVNERLTNLIKEIRYYKDDNDKVGTPFEVSEIILIPQGQHIHKIREEQEEALEHYLHAKSKGEAHLDHQLEHLERLHEEKRELVDKTITMMHNDSIAATNAIIIFETEPQKTYFLEHMDTYQEEGRFERHFGKLQEPIVIEEAPEPREIIYENLQYADVRVSKIMLGWGLSLLFLAVTTVVFYVLQLIKTNNLVAAIEEEEENPDSSTAKTQKVIATIIAWATLLGIVFFNKFVMGNVLHYFTHLEKHDNKAQEDFSFAFKYALGMFFTTALMTIMVEALKFKNYYKHDFGVIEEETIMFILCAFLIPLIWTIHPLQLCHLRARNNHYGHLDVTQHEANHLMADYHYDMGKRYAELIEMMWFTFLYADLIPVGAFLIFLGFCLYYWIDKYNLLRRSSLEGNISGDLAMQCLYLLDLTLFWRFLGELIFDVQIREGADTLTLVFLVLSILYMLVPWEAFLDLVNKEDFKPNDKRYSEEYHRFKDDNYRLHHPIYKESLEHLHSKGGENELIAQEILRTFNKEPLQPNSKSSAAPPNAPHGPNPNLPHAPTANVPLSPNIFSAILGATLPAPSPVNPQLQPSNSHASYVLPNLAPQKPNISFNYKK